MQKSTTKACPCRSLLNAAPVRVFNLILRVSIVSREFQATSCYKECEGIDTGVALTQSHGIESMKGDINVWTA
jgi:hypothetical protein